MRFCNFPVNSYTNGSFLDSNAKSVKDHGLFNAVFPIQWIAQKEERYRDRREAERSPFRRISAQPCVLRRAAMAFKC